MKAPSIEPTAAPADRAWRARTTMLLQQQGALIALALICTFAGLRYSAFLTPENVLNILRQNSMLGLLALGMTFVILTGGIDLSVGSLLAVAGVLAATLSAYGTATAVGVAVGGATLLGVANGVIIAKARIQPFIATLAMMIAARGIALGVTGDRSVPVDSVAGGLTWLGRGWIGPVPVPVIVLLAMYAVGWVVLRYTLFGRHIYAIGDSGETTRLMGLREDRVVIGVYALSGALAGVAGVLLAARLGAGQPVAGTGWELDAIAAVVVGGTLLTGGQGGVAASLVGVLLLGVIFNIFNLEGTIGTWWQWVLRGVFLLGVVIIQSRVQHGGRGPGA